MDPRIREHAETVVDHSVGLEAGDDVVVALPGDAEEFAVALHELCAERGANPLLLTDSERAKRAYLRAGESFETPEHERALYEAADATIVARGGVNPSERADVNPETTAAHSRAHQPVREERLQTRWCLTQVPSPGYAQRAGMSTEAYENFVWDAVSLDWEAQREYQAALAELLNEGEEVRIVAGDTTDLTMSVAGNEAINDFGEKNLPGGEVFTAPVRESVEGEVLFDLPLYREGREIEGASLRFEEGRVVDHAADRNEDLLASVLDTDEGARRLGELGVGMNAAIDRFTYNMLFDEKMDETVHLALGSAYPECVGGDNEVNESAQHVDMIVDVSEDARVEIDGDVVQRDGEFVFDDDE